MINYYFCDEYLININFMIKFKQRFTYLFRYYILVLSFIPYNLYGIFLIAV